MKYIAAFLLGLFTLALPFSTFGADIKLLGGFPYYLAGTGISSSATSIQLTSLTIPQNGYKVQDSDLESTFYLTIEPGSRSRQEFVSCTTVSQNSGGTATLSGCTRGLSPISPYTASSSLQFAHAGGSVAIFTDAPQIFNDLYNYVNGLALGSAVAASTVTAGYVELATAAEQAASTATGGTGASLVLTAANATSTYNSATAANQVLVTGGTGKIDSSFFSIATTTTIGSFPAYQIGKNIQTFTSAGTTTFSVPSGVSKLYVRLVGGGGGAGQCSTAGSNYASGGGGGGGGYAEEFVDVTGTSTIQVFVGSGGAATVSGTWSTFGTNGFYLSASGGTKGTDEGIGGAGGSGSAGDLNLTGGSGGSGSSEGTTNQGAAGGIGGSSRMGGGGAGAAAGSTGGAGAAGGNYGGGGGGAHCGSSDSQAGGIGAQGAAVVTW